jgi:hypothetical protein
MGGGKQTASRQHLERWNKTTTTTTKYNINKKSKTISFLLYCMAAPHGGDDNNFMPLPVAPGNNDNQQLAHQKNLRPRDMTCFSPAV